MRICICDEDSRFIKELRSRIFAFQTQAACFEISDFSCPEQLLEYYKGGGCFDIVFISVSPEQSLNGIEAAEKIREAAPKTIIIFVSEKSDFVFEAFRIEALHFLVKPVSQRDFAEAFTRAVKKYKRLNASLILKWESTRTKINIKEISYVEGYRRHLTVHTAGGCFEAVGKISEIYDALLPHGFVRVHQGFIINMNYIKCFRTGEVELTDGSKIPVSVRKQRDALRAYDYFIEKWEP